MALDGGPMVRARTRRAAFRAGGTGLGLLLAACGGTAPAPAAPAASTSAPAAPTSAPVRAVEPTAAPKAKAPVTLVLNGTDAEMGEMAAARLPAFEKQFPHVKIQYDNPPDYSTKLFVLAAAGSLGDVSMAYTNQGQYHFLSQNDVFADHEPFIARDKYDLKQFYDLAIQALRVNGKLYVLPFKGQIARLFLFFNLDAFEARGVPLPTAAWTYQDLLSASTKLHRAEGDQVQMWGYAGAWKELTTMIGSVRPWGGEIISADGKKALTSSPQVRESLQFHYDLALKHRTGGLTTQIDPNKAFYEGKAAMLGRVNAGTAGTILQQVAGKFRWGAVRMPKGPTGVRGGMWLPGAMSVTKNTKNPDDAWELTKWCCDKEAGVALSMQRMGSSTPGARPDVYADARLMVRDGYPATYGEEQRLAMLEPEPYITAWNSLGADLNTILGNELDKVTKGEAAVNDGFLQNVTGQLQAVLDKPPSRLR